MQEINFDYYEHGILIHGKALLLFTIDFQEEKTIKETDLKLHILKMSFTGDIRKIRIGDKTHEI